MPLDIQMFREFSGGRPDLIRDSQRKRFASVEIVDEIIAKDEKWRSLTGDIDNLRKRRNKIQKEEVAAKKKAGQNCDEEVAIIRQIDEQILQTEEVQKSLKIEVDKLVNKVGNIVEDSVPVSKDEDADNLVVRKWGVPRDPRGLLNHHDLLWRIGGFEPERGVAVAGHKGYFLKDVGVLLNQAFINYGIAFLRKRQYTMLQPPFFMRKDVMAGVAQLEEFDEALYKVTGDGEEKYLIATSEQPICGYHLDEWLDEKNLPLRYGGLSTCFRKESGSSGRDVWGIFRVHQFEKVEQFVIVEGDLEKSKAMQDEMIATAEEFYQSLGFPYHVINIVSGALNNAAIKKLDLEAWFPGYNSYRELVSCSNCTDYQSRSMGIRQATS
jgi:seryl-tRNA synthetase